MSTRSTPHLPRPVLGVCGWNNVRRVYETCNDAGDSVLFLRHDKRPRLDPLLYESFGNYEKRNIPDLPVPAVRLQTSVTRSISQFRSAARLSCLRYPTPLGKSSALGKGGGNARAGQHYDEPPAEDDGHAGAALDLGEAGEADPGQHQSPDGEDVERGGDGI
jgi:hypothetical protein